MTDVFLKRFQPIHLKLENVGPFRSAFEMPITGFGDAPANFYLLASRNGFGKTTILEVIYGLMRGLAQPTLENRRFLHPDLRAGGSAQLDIRMELESAGKSSSVVVSLFTGADDPLLIYTPSRLEAAQAGSWIPLKLRGDGIASRYEFESLA
jgi:recombinational DNA repair ATPase RecF